MTKPLNMNLGQNLTYTGTLTALTARHRIAFCRDDGQGVHGTGCGAELLLRRVRRVMLLVVVSGRGGAHLRLRHSLRPLLTADVLVTSAARVEAQLAGLQIGNISKKHLHYPFLFSRSVAVDF